MIARDGQDGRHPAEPVEDRVDVAGGPGVGDVAGMHDQVGGEPVRLDGREHRLEALQRVTVGIGPGVGVTDV